MIDMSVKIGNVVFKNPVLTASGTFGYGDEISDLIDVNVIGGIITKTKRSSQSGFPGLSKIPILGWLFKAKTKSDRKEELLIFITSRIVHLEQPAVAESY